MTTALAARGIAADDPFGLGNLPYGSALVAGQPHLMARIGSWALDLTAAATGSPWARWFAGGTLDALLSGGPGDWAAARAQVRAWLEEADAHWLDTYLLPLAGLPLRLAFTVADYVDFYASEHHAANVGRILRPGSAELAANWKHLPVGYHGRAGTVVVSGTPVPRPIGQFRVGEQVRFGPTEALDFEAEVGFVVGNPTAPGSAVDVGAFAEHVFGVLLLNDWSARDIQAWEYVPLGPFLGKSFATSVSAWVTPLAALADAWIPGPAQDPPPLPYLRGPSFSLNLGLTVELNGTVITRPRADELYWTPAQLLAHQTVNGARLRAGDLFGSGTVSGPLPAERGCLLELSWGGRTPLRLSDGSARTYLEDGDEVRMTAMAPGRAGPLALGEVTGRVLAARLLRD